MKRRVQFIKDKIKKHTPTRPRPPKGHIWGLPPRPALTKDQIWLGACWVGLDSLLAGQKERAMIAFGHAGWPLTGPAMERLGQFLDITKTHKLQA